MNLKVIFWNFFNMVVVCWKFLWNRITRERKFKTADELFLSGGVFNAKDIELENIVKQISSKDFIGPTLSYREIVRVLVVNNIQNQRFIKSIENRNFILTLVIISLTFYSIYLTRIQIGPILLEQERSERRAYEICKNLPDGEYESLSGVIYQCEDVFGTLKSKFEN